MRGKRGQGFMGGGRGVIDLVLDSGGLVTGVWDMGRLGEADHSMLKIELNSQGAGQ